MGKDNIAENILYNAGGRDNIERLGHCATRLRINIRDLSMVNIPDIEREKEVIRVVISGDQLQIIIGSHVTQVYDAINKLYLHDGEGGHHKQDEKKQNLITIFKNCSGAISAIMTPFIGPLIAAGLLKGSLSIAFNLGLISISSGPLSVLYHLHDAIFLFLPFFIAYTASIAFGGSTTLMLSVTASLFFTFTGYPGTDSITIADRINMHIYSTTVFPVIFCVLFSAFIERIIKKIIINSASFIIVPLLTLLIAIPVSIYALGPVGLWLGKSLAFYYTIGYQAFPVLICIIIAGAWQLSVLVGLHWVFALIMLNTLAINGYDTALPLLIPAVLGQAGAFMAVWVVNIAKKKQTPGGISAVLSAISGLTEPVIYKVNLPLCYPFVIGCLSAAIGGLFYGIYQIKIYSFGILGILSLLQTKKPGADGYIASGLLGAGTAFMTAFLITILYIIIRKEVKTINIKQEK